MYQIFLVFNMKHCEICAKEVTMEIVWIQSRDNGKKTNLLWRNHFDAHKLVIESHFKMIQSNMKSKRSKCKRSSLSSVLWAIEECVGLTGVIEIFTLVYFCCCHVSIYVLTSKYIAMSKHNQRIIPEIKSKEEYLKSMMYTVHMNHLFYFNIDTIKTN